MHVQLHTYIYIHIYVQTLGNIAVCEKIPSVLLTRFYEKKRLTLEKNSSRYGRCYTDRHLCYTRRRKRGGGGGGTGRRKNVCIEWILNEFPSRKKNLNRRAKGKKGRENIFNESRDYPSYIFFQVSRPLFTPFEPILFFFFPFSTIALCTALNGPATVSCPSSLPLEHQKSTNENRLQWIERRKREGIGKQGEKRTNWKYLRVAKTFRGVDRLRDRRVGQVTGTMSASRR